MTIDVFVTTLVFKTGMSLVKWFEDHSNAGLFIVLGSVAFNIEM